MQQVPYLLDYTQMVLERVCPSVDVNFRMGKPEHTGHGAGGKADVTSTTERRQSLPRRRGLGAVIGHVRGGFEHIFSDLVDLEAATLSLRTVLQVGLQ